MTQEEKQLLIKALCGYFPYGVICSVVHKKDGRLVEEDMKLSGMFEYGNFYFLDEMGSTYSDKYIPYLRPMSSMTEEERIEFSKLLVKRYCEIDWEGHISTSYCIEIDNVYTDDENGIKYPSTFSMDAIDWLNAHHFDYRGLIDKGLALPASDGK